MFGRVVGDAVVPAVPDDAESRGRGSGRRAGVVVAGTLPVGPVGVAPPRPRKRCGKPTLLGGAVGASWLGTMTRGGQGGASQSLWTNLRPAGMPYIFGCSRVSMNATAANVCDDRGRPAAAGAAAVGLLSGA